MLIVGDDYTSTATRLLESHLGRPSSRPTTRNAMATQSARLAGQSGHLPVCHRLRVRSAAGLLAGTQVSLFRLRTAPHRLDGHAPEPVLQSAERAALLDVDGFALRRRFG